MPFIRLCLIVFSALILTSCTFPEDGEPAEYPEFFGHADPAATLESISAAIRSGKVFIQDEKDMARYSVSTVTGSMRKISVR